ncbi:MAG: hypothetical protein ACM3ST_08245 [Bdellovibrio bacteriovorus]
MIGLIYAPLFIGLSGLFDLLGVGRATHVAAAALAGGAGAVLYAGREVALLGTGVGLLVGVLSLLAGPHLLSFQSAALAAAVLAALIGLHPAFPARCDRQVPSRVLVGIATGGLVGAILAIAEPLHPEPFSTFAVVAFLVSVNGVLYVAAVAPLLSLTRRMSLALVPCSWVEALVAGSLAGLAAGSVWVMAGPFLGDGGALVQAASEAVYRQLPEALLAGIFGGLVAGALLGIFRFPWVHET